MPCIDLLAVIDEPSPRCDVVDEDTASGFVLLLVLELKSLLRQLSTLRRIVEKVSKGSLSS